jgi:dTDP-4-dehydrorhamnose 3,5-epimerase
MNVIETEIAGIKIVEPDIRRDERGYFCETYNRRRYFDAGITAEFVQDNESFSMKGVIRGLHWQVAPFGQAKLVRVIRGKVLDVAVDLRKGSSTFGRHIATELSADNGRQFFIPRGFAHGFLVLEDNTIFSYKCDNFYHPEADGGISILDETLNIDWGLAMEEALVSEKDAKHVKLAEFDSPFIYKENC